MINVLCETTAVDSWKTEAGSSSRSEETGVTGASTCTLIFNMIQYDDLKGHKYLRRT